jgi:hypothetical protein
MSDADRIDPQLAAALRRIAEEAVVPPLDPAQEQKLLAAFDEQLRSQRTPRMWHAGLAAGMLAIAATMLFAVTRPVRPPAARRPLEARNPVAQLSPAALVRSPEPARLYQPALPAPAFALRASAGKLPDGTFVMWPGAQRLPRFESGELMRVDMPASMVVSLGLRPSRPLRGDGTVQTDVLVGQDGYARAVRLVR